jgi:hypothetical protein
MSKKAGLSAAFTIGDQPILDVAPIPNPGPKAVAQPLPLPTPSKRDHRANRQAFTVWLDRDLVSRIRALSRDLVNENGRPGNSIEAMVAEGIEHVLKKHGRELARDF